MKPADLHSGDRFDTEFGALVVAGEPWEDRCDDTPQWDRVFVDIEVPDQRQFGDADRLPEVTGAAEFQWLGLLPLRYRLAFRHDTDVEVTR